MIRLKRLYAHNFKQLQEIELKFPDHARILVQGKNEAGKSTLFEAVFFALFGNALATETGARGLDDLIRYDIEKARVELDVHVERGNRLLKIARSIVRGKQNVWELDIARDGQIIEEIRGNTVVNKRLVAELGFDGEALLNTCFVEQKKLEKLEGLSKAKREESLAKLLNLDALVAIENELKVTGEDKRELDRLKKRADLAAIQAELPTLENQLAKTEEQLKLIDLSGAVDGTLSELRAVQQIDAAIQTLARERAQTLARVERIEALKLAMQEVKTACGAIERIADNAREIERMKQEQVETQRAVNEIPSLKNQIANLRRLAHFIARLEQVRNARERYAQRAMQIASVEKRLVDLNTTIATEEDTLAQLDARLREFEIDEAMSTWVAARREVAPASQAAETVQLKQLERDQLARRFRIELFGFGGLALALAAAAFLVPMIIVAQTGAAPLSLIAAPALAFFVLSILVVILLAIRATTLWREVSRAAEELGRAEGEVRAHESVSESQRARLNQAEARLTQLGIAIPQSMELAQAQRSSHEQSVEELRAAQNATRERWFKARAVLNELQQQNAVDESTNLPAERARNERAAQKAESILARWQARLQTVAQALNVGVDLDSVRRAEFQLQAKIEQLQWRGIEANRLTEEIATREKSRESLLAQARELYEKARLLKPNGKEWDAALTLDDYTTLGKELRAEYDVLGGESAGKQARELEGELGRRQGERATRQRNVDLLYARVHELLGKPNPLAASPVFSELEKLQARLQTLELGDEATLRQAYRELVGRVRSLSDRQSQIERELGLQGHALDRIECQQKWEQKMREAMAREKGVEIASIARRRIVQKILPATMDYMRQILPTLTRDRYHDAQLDPETYKIQVWDERVSNGGAFKEKNIFSGGTKDQFSLALRLAFALATLPSERGSAPSFIFLDEPLGSFDDERAEALIYLLTEGEIARAFDQIFLISHVHVNERLFTHRLVLEHGRVAETDLPNE